MTTINTNTTATTAFVVTPDTTGTFVVNTGSGVGATAMTIDSSANLQFNSGYGSVATAYGCRAWVNFDGTTNVGGFCTIRASGNVSSVADGGVGIYTVNITTAMPDVNYCVNASAVSSSISLKIRVMTGYTASAVTVRTSGGDTSVQSDCESVFVSIFR